MTKLHTRVIGGPCIPDFHGPVARVVELPDGSGRIEVWKRGAGWVTAPDGAFNPGNFMPGYCRPPLEKDAARLGCRLEDFGRHWTEEPATARDRARLIHALKTRAWDLACHRMTPGHA